MKQDHSQSVDEALRDPTFRRVIYESVEAGRKIALEEGLSEEDALSLACYDKGIRSQYQSGPKTHATLLKKRIWDRIWEATYIRMAHFDKDKKRFLLTFPHTNGKPVGDGHKFTEETR